MAEFLVIGLVVGIIFFAVSRVKVNTIPNSSDTLVIEKKQCPPHAWFWQEIVDQHGVKQGERICCKVCGPLASQSGKE